MPFACGSRLASAGIACLLPALALACDRTEPAPGPARPAARARPATDPPVGEIVFITERAGRAEIHAIRPDGGARRTLAASPGADLFPATGAGSTWLLAIRTTGGESDAHQEQLATLEPTGRLTAPLLTAGRVRNPSMPRDGRWVAVESDLRSFRDIYRVPLAGGPARRLTDSRHGNFEPAVSPGGEQIAFTSSRDGNAEIYIMPAGGGRQTRLTAFHRDDWSPVWSPDGASLAFLSAREGPARVFLMRPDGTGQRRLLADWDQPIEEEAPAFSPDGSRLALVARRVDGGGEVWVADLRSGRRWPISADRARDATPAWSPDGRHLVFTSESGGQSDLQIAAAEGGGRRSRLTSDPAPEWLPRWIARPAN